MHYMVTFTLSSSHQAEIIALIPEEQAHIVVSKERGIVETLYLSSENGGGRGWIVMKGESKEQIEKELEGFPLHPYMSLEIVALR